MATVVLRPTSVISSTGWDTSTDVIANSFDEDNATYTRQNNTTWNAHYILGELDSGLSGATINSYTISAYAKGGRAGAFSADLHLIDDSDQNVASPETESWTGTLSTQTTTADTTKSDGSSALTYAYINGCTLYFDPNNQGAFLYEIYVTVDYTAATGYGDIVNGVAVANIGKVNGVATANIGKVNGVD